MSLRSLRSFGAYGSGFRVEGMCGLRLGVEGLRFMGLGLEGLQASGFVRMIFHCQHFRVYEPKPTLVLLTSGV